MSPKRLSNQIALFEDQGESRVNKFINGDGEVIIKVQGNIPLELPIKNGQHYLFISQDQSSLTHGLHKYPAKFFPELPRWLIEKYTKPGDWVIDPFTGSATTNVECLFLGRHSVGIEIDPFARFLARVKLTPLNVDMLLKSQMWIQRQLLDYPNNIPIEKEFPFFPYRDNWFKKFILEELTYIKRKIGELKGFLSSNGDEREIINIQNYFLVCFSSIIRSVSNADNNCTRTVVRKKLNKRIRPGNAIIKFGRALAINTPKMVEFSEGYKKDIKVDIPENQDARNLMYPDNSFDLALTSPPYINAVDYPRTHQLEMYWLGFQSGSLAPLKKIHVGTETVSSNEYSKFHLTGYPELDKVLKMVYKKDPRRSFIIYKFFIDMKKNLQEVFRVLRPGARYAIVIGNNVIRGILVETWRYLMDIGEDVGYDSEMYFASEIINHFIKVPRKERINTDWILILCKPGGAKLVVGRHAK